MRLTAVSLRRLGAVLTLGACVTAEAGQNSDYAARVARVLAATPLIDGHNDLAAA